MKSQWLSSCTLLLMLCASPALAQHGVFTSRTAFQSATSGYTSSTENFDGFANGQQISSLFSGLVTFDSPSPTDFYGSWNAHGTGGQFSGGSLIPEPRFAGRPLVLLFNSPVFGVGANVFDDFDGSPLINVLTLTVTTANGNKISVTENFANIGDTGFLGVTSPDGIVRAEFSIDNTNGNLEIDLLTVARMRAPGSCSTSADCASGQTCSSGTCVAACTNTTWTDLSGKGHHGTLVNFAGTSASGWMGSGTPADPYALRFDGQNDHVELAPASDGLRFTDQLTLEVWAYHDQTPGGAQLFTNRDGTWQYSGISLQPNWYYAYSSTGSSWNFLSTPATVGVWNHAVATYSRSSGLYRLFINGVEKASGSATQPIYYGAGALPRIGADKGGVYPYQGRISMLRMWSSAMTPAEITELYRTNASRFGLSAPAPAGLSFPAPEAHYEAGRCGSL